MLNTCHRESRDFFHIDCDFNRIEFRQQGRKKDFSNYNSAVLCGPLYMGRIPAPLNDLIK